MAQVHIEHSRLVKNVFAIFNRVDEKRGAEPVCIFKVPNSQSSTKPEAYVPQQVGLGPFHHQRVEIQNMQTYKLAEAKRILMAFGGSVWIEKLVELLQKMIVPSVGARYNTYLDMPDTDLACIMAIDGLFLFDLLGFYGIDNYSSNFEIFRKLASSDERKLDRDSTLRDAMILESQIPMLVLKFILIVEGKHSVSHFEKMEVDSLAVVGEFFPQILLGFCQAVSPLNVLKNYPPLKALRHHHLLDLLYHLMVLKDLPSKNFTEEEEEVNFIKDMSNKFMNELYRKAQKRRAEGGAIKLDILEGMAGVMDSEGIVGVMDSEVRKAFKVAEGLGGISFQTLISSIQDLTAKEPPVLLPRASKLCVAGVKFCHGEDNHVTNIRFDPNTASFQLPVIRLNVNSEVIIRNLVAYEGMINSESKSLVLRRYSELMIELIETVEDVKVLTDHGIISKSDTIDDEEIAKMFTGMRKRERVTNPLKDDDKLVPLERAIKDVKSYYDGKWKVKVKKWGRITWKLNKVLFAFVVVFLLATQSVCSVYDCPGLHHLKNTSQLQPSSLGRKLNWI